MYCCKALCLVDKGHTTKPNYWYFHDVNQMVISVSSPRVYPASEGASPDRLCCCQADGDQSAGAAGTGQSEAILKGITNAMG